MPIAQVIRFSVCMALLPLWTTATPAFGALLTFVEAQVDGVNGVQDLAQPSAVAVSPDGRQLYVASMADAAVAGFDRNASSGRLTFTVAQRNGQAGVHGLGGAAALALSPDGAHLYAAGSSEAAVTVFARDAATGQLDFVEAQTQDANDALPLGGVSSLAVSPDGRNVYATSRTDNALVVFRRDTETGALTFVEAHVNGLDGVDWLAGAIAVVASPDGADVYVAAFDIPTLHRKSVVTMLRRDRTTGSLTFNGELVAGADGLIDVQEQPLALAMPAAGTQLYVASFDRDITVFNRDAVTGLLSFVQSANVLPGGSKALTVSPDGARLYVTSFINSTRSELNVFTRAGDGAVTYKETYADGENAQGVNGAIAVAVSPDNQHVYVAGRFDNALAVFASAGGAPTPTATASPTATPSAPPTPTATLTVPVCAGDCGLDGEVTVNELLIMVNIALSNTDVGACSPGDTSHDGEITIDEILKAVNNVLGGC